MTTETELAQRLADALIADESSDLRPDYLREAIKVSLSTAGLALVPVERLSPSLKDADVEAVARAIALELSGGKSDNPNGAEIACARAALAAMPRAPSIEVKDGELLEVMEWLLGIAAGVVEMGDPNYERACALYEQIAALPPSRATEVTEAARIAGRDAVLGFGHEHWGWRHADDVDDETRDEAEAVAKRAYLAMSAVEGKGNA